MSSFGIGAKLRQERVGRGLAIDDISRDTRIAPRFLEAIETDDYSTLPGIVFTRNFVRQYALTLQLDPDPLLAELPKPDESTAPLPNPPSSPERPRSSYHRDRRMRSIRSSTAWLLVIGGVGAAYIYFHKHSPRAGAPQTRPAAASPKAAETPGSQKTAVVQTAGAASAAMPPAKLSSRPSPVFSSKTAPVQVSLTTHDESAWVQVSADGRIAFTGMLKPNETKEVSAAEQVKVTTGNAGALTISLNGKTLDSIGPLGEVRAVRLTAEGPQLLSKAPPPAPDRL